MTLFAAARRKRNKGKVRYRLLRRAVRWILRPRIVGAPPPQLSGSVVYALPLRSLLDLIVLDIVCAEQRLPNPLAGFQVGERREGRSFVFLARPAGWRRRHTMRTYSQRLLRLTADAEATDVQLLPVQVFWGRTANRQRSLIGNLLSETWSATSRLRRLCNLFIARRHILVGFGAPLPLGELGGGDGNRRFRRCARLLRAQLHGQRVAVLGPDLSHRRTLVGLVTTSSKVQEAVEEAVARRPPSKPAPNAIGWKRKLAAKFRPERGADATTLRKRLQAKARQAALEIAADLSYPTVFTLERLLSSFFKRIYGRMRVNGLERITGLAETHTLIYLPSHRSHMDYLLLSLLLLDRGLMIPHIAAGNNLDLPLVGGLLRRCGAFFMRRSFRDDPIYAAVLSEYLYEVYKRGHCVEFFPEGGRSRTGRLLPARLGLLKMTLEHSGRSLPRPIALVPVYLGYEKLIEGDAYVDELRGAEKRRESFWSILSGFKLMRRRYGRVDLNIGRPLVLEEWRKGRPAGDPKEAEALGREVLERVNQAASVNPVNIAAMTLLCAPRSSMEAPRLQEQIDCCLDLLRRHAAHHDWRITAMNGAAIIDYLVQLGMLVREQESFGEIVAAKPNAAVLLTWYRNNAAHVLALPSCIAFLMDGRRRPLGRERLRRMVETIYPFTAWELHAAFAPSELDPWVNRLTECGLLQETDAQLRPPPADSPARRRLHLLASMIRQTLERQYIVLSLLVGSTALTREGLKEQSQRIAHKMARLHGINAPEFFDPNLFDGFVEQLIGNGVVTEAADGRLGYASLLKDIMRASSHFIDAEFRHAVLHG